MEIISKSPRDSRKLHSHIYYPVKDIRVSKADSALGPGLNQNLNESANMFLSRMTAAA